MSFLTTLKSASCSSTTPVAAMRQLAALGFRATPACSATTPGEEVRMYGAACEEDQMRGVPWAVRRIDGEGLGLRV